MESSVLPTEGVGLIVLMFYCPIVFSIHLSEGEMESPVLPTEGVGLIVLMSYCRIVFQRSFIGG